MWKKKTFLLQVCLVEVRACSSLHSPNWPLWQSSYLGLPCVGISCINHLIPFSCIHFMSYSLGQSHSCNTHVLRLLVPCFLLCSGSPHSWVTEVNFLSLNQMLPFCQLMQTPVTHTACHHPEILRGSVNSRPLEGMWWFWTWRALDYLWTHMLPASLRFPYLVLVLTVAIVNFYHVFATFSK